MDTQEYKKEFFSFLKKHQNLICKELQDSFNQNYKDVCNTILRRCDFAGLVGIPLFVVLLIWIVPLKAYESSMIPVATIVTLGFLIRLFTKHVVTISCRYFFEHKEYRETVVNYVKKCQAEALSNAKSEKQKYDISMFFDQCCKDIVLEDFRYYK